MQSRFGLAAVSGALRELAIELAGSRTTYGSSAPADHGLAEIRLPAVQPGSSIMPGKVNPVIAECLNMIAFQVVETISRSRWASRRASSSSTS